MSYSFLIILYTSLNDHHQLNSSINTSLLIFFHPPISFAPPLSPALDVDLTYFNAAWTGVRGSHLPWALEPNPQTGLFNYQDPADVDHLELKPWGNDGPTPSPPGYTCAPLSSERTDLKNLWGYTTFATNDLIVKQPELTKWCRKPEGCTVDNFPTDGCMVPTCRCPNSDQVWEGYTEIDLKVPANSRPDCAYHTGWQGKVSLECNLRDETGFGKTTPYMNGGSGSGLKFVNSLMEKVSKLLLLDIGRGVLAINEYTLQYIMTMMVKTDLILKLLLLK